MKEFVRRHETTAFVALTFGLGWAMWTLSGILRRADLRAPDWRWALAQVGVFALPPPWPSPSPGRTTRRGSRSAPAGRP